jgi:hypothetical protein
MSLKIRTSFNFLQKASHYRKKERKEKNSHQTPDTTTDGGMEETKPFLLRFKVKDYLNLPYEPGCCVYSERVRGKDRSVWQLQLYPGGATDDDDVISDENNVYMSVFLHYVEGPNISAKTTFILRDAHGNAYHRSTSDNVDTYIVGKECFGYFNFIRRSSIVNEASIILLHGTLVIDVEVRMIPLRTTRRMEV